MWRRLVLVAVLQSAILIPHDAFVLPAGGEPALVDLGQAGPLDEALAAWREALARAGATMPTGGEARAERRLSPRAKALHELVFAPLQKHLGDSTNLFVAPDGQLNLLPFETLQDQSGAYLIERFSFDYLSSGRDLLRFGYEAPHNGAAVLVAAPDFDGGAAPSAAAPGEARAEGVPPSRGLRGHGFTQLPGAEAEAQTVAALLAGRRPEVHSGKGATEAAVKRLHSPRLLHFATHGFFLEDQDFSAAVSRGSRSVAGDDWQTATLAGIENPLIRSGLALAGANRFAVAAASGEDGLLTASEVSGLDLTGTDLVVLSACDTGLGEVKTGEGVFGLRRAFLHAGAKTLIMSLAKVPDEETRQLMVEFYRRWLESGNKVQALRGAQLSIIKLRRAEHGAAHPLYWGAFIAVGEP